MVSERKRLDESALGGLGFKDYEELSAKIMAEGGRLSSIEGIRPFFTLSPPKGGFKRSTRRQYGEGGVARLQPQAGRDSEEDDLIANQTTQDEAACEARGPWATGRLTSTGTPASREGTATRDCTSTSGPGS